MGLSDEAAIRERIEARLDPDTFFMLGRLDAARADLAAMTARAEQAEAQVAGLNVALASRGLEGATVEGLLRHERNNEAATQGAWKIAYDAALGQVGLLRMALTECAGSESPSWSAVLDYTAVAAAAHDAEVERRAVERIVERVEAVIDNLPDSTLCEGAWVTVAAIRDAILGGPDEPVYVSPEPKVRTVKAKVTRKVAPPLDIDGGPDEA